MTDNRTLYAFYDLATSTPKFDFFVFLVSSEMYRIRHGYARTHYIFVPGEKDGFRGFGGPPQDPAVLMAMMRNITLPGCWLAPGCACVSHMSSREEALILFDHCAGHFFPRGYSLSHPVNEYHWQTLSAGFIRGETLPEMSAPYEKRRAAEAFCERVAADKRVVTITMREAEYYPERNSNIDAWRDFVESRLDRETYAPVVIRDTSNAHADPLIPGAPECPLASIDINFRAALYQAAFVNLHVSNGPMMVSYFLGTPTLVFKSISNAEHFATSEEYFRQEYGLTPGDQYFGMPDSLRLTWSDDTLETIASEFETFAAHVENHQNEHYGVNGFSSEISETLVCDSVVDFANQGILRGTFEDDRQTLLSLPERYRKNHPMPFNLLGVWYAQAGRTDEAEEALVQALEIEPESEATRRNLVLLMLREGHLEKARSHADAAPATMTFSEPEIEFGFTCTLAQGNDDAVSWMADIARASGMTETAIKNMIEQSRAGTTVNDR